MQRCVLLTAPPHAIGEYESLALTRREVRPASEAPSTACSHRPVPARARAARACPAERDDREGPSSDDRAHRIRGGCEPHGSPSPGGGARAPTHPQTPERGPRTTSATPWNGEGRGQSLTALSGPRAARRPPADTVPPGRGAVRSDARGGSQALESCRPAALAAARRGASVDFTHTHTWTRNAFFSLETAWHGPYTIPKETTP